MKRITAILLLLALTLPFLPAAHADSVEPLLDGWVRQQKDPFNRLCPFYIDDNGKNTGQRCQVGCVATALESIISYHRRVIELQDVMPAWSTNNFTTADIPAGTSVDTRLVLLDYGDGTAASVGMGEEEYAEAVDAVARLSLMCGMMAQMNWGLGSSGADAGNLVDPLKNILGWKTAEYIDSYKYTPEQWREILKNELRNGRPVLYTGYTMSIDGHAFVVDGFDENDRFHVNWGYGGAYDGNYYDITQLAVFANQKDILPTDVQMGFFCNQQALILSPDEVDTTLLADSLHRTGKEIAIESMTVDGTALTNKYIPVNVTLRNTADIPLCSPFEIFTNAATDKDLFRDGDYGALFGVNMEPGERRTVTVACRFSKKGSRTMHISPDDVTVLGNCVVYFTAGTADNLAFDALEVEFTRDPLNPAAGVDATFSVPVTNLLGERSGSLVTYCLMQGTEVKDGDWRHFEYYYLPAGATETRQVTFRGLTPGDEHLFALRQPWTIRQSYAFTVPDILVGDKAVLTLEPQPDDATWYDLTGRRTNASAGRLLIHGGKKMLR